MPLHRIRRILPEPSAAIKNRLGPGLGLTGGTAADILLAAQGEDRMGHRAWAVYGTIVAAALWLLGQGRGDATEPADREPWSVDAACPVLRPGNSPGGAWRQETDSSYGRQLCRGLLRFYQTILSRLNTTRCSMAPSCSNYSLQAIAKHGPALGIVLTTDRLIHERDEKRYVPDRMRDGVRLYLDPVENNDFWWGTR